MRAFIFPGPIMEAKGSDLAADPLAAKFDRVGNYPSAKPAFRD